MSDNLIVNRNNTTYQVDMENLRTIEATDLLLVNRDGTTYTVTGDKVSAGGDFSQVNLAPLSGTPEFEVTATTDLPSILDKSTINYKWYRYSASTGGTGTLLQELTSDSAILDTYTTTAADQGNYIGCTVTYLGTAVSETARTQCLTAPGPIATMHGLRFDSSRSTFLSRENHNTGNYFTCSFWIKPTTSSNEWVWQSKPTAGSASNQYGLFKNTNFEWEFVSENTINSVSTYELNVWTNIVIVSRPTFDVDIYVDGDLKGTYNRSFIANENVFAIGGAREASQYNGYLSDFYLVSDQSLPPTTFGKTFEPYGWGPLDSTQIKENIGDTVVQPYDQRANTDQVWSSNLSGADPAAPETYAFDGNVGAPSAEGLGAGSTLTYTGALSGKLEFYRSNGMASESAVTYNVGNGEQPFAFGQWVSAGTVDISSFTIKGNPSNPAALTAVRLDGRLLVDNGVWDNSQNWSINGTSTGGYSSIDRTWAKAFDGIAEVGANSVNPSSGETASCTFPTSPTFTTLRIFCGYGGVAIPDGFKVNNQDITSQVGDQNWYTITGVSSPLTSISLTRTSGFDPLLHAIELDGAILVDEGAQWNTSQVWSGNTLGTPFNETYSIEKAYDGSFQTRALAAADTDLVLTASPAITVNTSLRINLKIDDFSGVDVLKVNGTDYSNLIDKTGRYWVTIPKSEIQTLTFGRTTGAGIEQCSVAAIEVDGKLLVDGGSFGDNGFYLSFDPESPATEDYPELWDNDVENPDTCFVASTNEDPSNVCWARQWYGTGYGTGDYADGVSQNYVWTLETPIVGNVECIFNCQSGGYGTLAKLNDKQVNMTQISSGNRKILTDTKLESITLQSFAREGGNALQRTGIESLKVNGKTLTVFNGIGTDDSGSGNNFTDENFSLLPYAPGANVDNWIGKGAWTISCTGNQSDILNKSYLFDGTTWRGPSGKQGINPCNIRYTFDTPRFENSKVELFVNVWNDSFADRDVRFASTSTGESSVRANFGNVGNAWVDITSLFLGNLTYVEFGNYGGSDTNRAPSGLEAIRVDGKVLVNPEYDVFLEDNVTDTPLRNYSVITVNGENGNLECVTGQGSSLLSVKPDDKVYYEAYISSGSPSYHIRIREEDSTASSPVAYLRNDGTSGLLTKLTGSFKQFGAGSLLGIAYDSSIGNNGGFDYYVDGVWASKWEINDGAFSSSARHLLVSGGNCTISHNFGQQEFNASNVTYDQATGTVEIAAEISPYETRANTDQVWSTGTASPSATTLFDGDLTTPWIGRPATFSPTTSIPFISTFEVYSGETGLDYCEVEVDGVAQTRQTLTGGEWTTVASGGGNITKITAGDNRSNSFDGAIYSVKADGRLLVDNGVWDLSQYWSDSVTFVEDGIGDQDFYKMFDGDLSANGGVSTDNNNDGTNNVLEFTFNNPPTVTSSVTLITNSNENHKSWKVNNLALVTNSTSPNEITFNFSGTLDSIYGTTNWGGTNSLGLAGIKVDGILLVDSGEQWNTSKKWSDFVFVPSPTGDNNPSAAFIASDPLTQQDGITALTSGTSTISTVSLPITLTNSTVRVYYSLNNSQSSFSGLVAGDKSNATSVPVNSRYYTEVTGCTGTNITMTFSYTGGAGSTCYIYQYVVDGKVLVDPSGGTYNTLFQTWEESKVVVFRAQIAAANLLMAALTEHAQTYDASENYCEGSVIKAFGELWIAVNDAPPTAFADLPSLVSHSNWERLGISV